MTANNQKTVQPGNLKKLPNAPDTLGDAGKIKWKQIGAELVAMQMADKVDVHALEQLCIAYDRVEMASRELGESGFVCVSEKGGQYLNPMFSVLSQAEKQVDIWMQRLGLSRKQRVDLVVKEAEISQKVAARRRSAK